MDSLPDDVIFHTALEANVEETEKLTKTSKKIKKLVETANFWKRKYLKDVDTTEDMKVFKKLLFNEEVEGIDSIAYRWGYNGKIQNILLIINYRDKRYAPYYFLKGYMESPLFDEIILLDLTLLVDGNSSYLQKKECSILLESKISTEIKIKVLKIFCRSYETDMINSYVLDIDRSILSDKRKVRILKKLKTN